MSALSNMTREYNPTYVKRNACILKRAGLFNRLMFGVFHSNATFAIQPFISIIAGTEFGMGAGASFMAIVAIGYQFGKVLSPLFKEMKMSLLLKVFLVTDMISILVICIGLLSNNNIFLVVSLELLGISIIGLGFAYETRLTEFMASTPELSKHIRRFNYTSNTIGLFVKFIVGCLLATVSLLYVKFSLVIGVVMLVLGLKYQFKFMQEVESKGY